MASRKQRVRTSIPEIEGIELGPAKPAPKDYHVYDLETTGYDGWQFVCVQPDMEGWARAMKVAAPVFESLGAQAESSGGRLTPVQVAVYLQRFGELWPQIAKVAANVVADWNFVDQGGTPLPTPWQNAKVIQDLPNRVARDFGMDVLNFVAWASGGEESAECPHCGAEVLRAWLHCPSCTNPIELRCRNTECQRVVEPDWLACPFCGEDLAGAEGNSRTP